MHLYIAVKFLINNYLNFLLIIEPKIYNDSTYHDTLVKQTDIKKKQVSLIFIVRLHLHQSDALKIFSIT